MESHWYAANGAEMFSQSPFNLYQAPFASRATFRTGKLTGHWIITDQNERKICDWNFVDGRRDGKSSWWYPNGNPMREINYVAGQVHGELLEWDEGGKLVTRVEYEDGRRLDQAVQKYKDGQKQYEGDRAARAADHEAAGRLVGSQAGHLRPGRQRPEARRLDGLVPGRQEEVLGAVRTRSCRGPIHLVAQQRSARPGGFVPGRPETRRVDLVARERAAFDSGPVPQ